MFNHDVDIKSANLADDNALNNQQYLTFAYDRPLLGEENERKICQKMERQLAEFISLFAEDPELLDELRDFILASELDASRASLAYLGKQDPHGLNLLGIIDELETIYHIGLKRGARRVARKLKTRLAMWRPPTYSIAKVFINNESTLKAAPQPLRRKLSKLKYGYLKNRNQMIQSNLRLVLSVASKYKHLGTPYDDLVQEGNMGLIKAIEHFDFSKGYRFSTYAYRIISQSVHLAVDKNSSLVRRPFKMMRDKKVVERIRNQIEQQLGQQPKLADIEKALPKKVDNLPDLLRNSAAISADTLPQSADNDGFAPDLPDERLTTLADQSHTSGAFGLISEAIEGYSEREQMIIRMKYGIGLRKEYTLDEIGRYFGLSRERVRQIYLKCLAQLQEQVAHIQ